MTLPTVVTTVASDAVATLAVVEEVDDGRSDEVLKGLLVTVLVSRGEVAMTLALVIDTDEDGDAGLWSLGGVLARVLVVGVVAVVVVIMVAVVAAAAAVGDASSNLELSSPWVGVRP